MCFEVKKVVKNTRVRYGYKLVHCTSDPKVFRSGTKVLNRSAQLVDKLPGRNPNKFWGYGTRKEYRMNQVTHSPIPDTPGIYCYTLKGKRRMGDPIFGEAWIKVEIPVGATMMVGDDVFTASRVKVVKAYW